MQISAIMTRYVRTCAPEDTLKMPAQIMWDNDCGSVPVVDADQRVVGMITDRDICMASLFRDEPPSGIPVGEVMSKNVFTCRPDQSVAEAEWVMKDKQIRRIPIVDGDNHLVGILSLADIAQTMRSQPPSSSHELTLAAVGDTLARIAQRPEGPGSYY